MKDTSHPVLEMKNISKTFGPVKALADVSLSAFSGEVHALIGENGAGKSTLMKILSGAYMPDRGSSILVNGQLITGGNTKAAKMAGVAVIYQELSLAPNLTVAENIFLGNEFAHRGIIDRAAMHNATQPVLDRLGVDFLPTTRVRDLSLGERQLVEIGRAISCNARIIVMDEPTTSLSSTEAERLFEVMRSLIAENISIIYISHRMEEVFRLADRCSVLRDGKYIGTLERADLNENRLIAMMVGRELSTFYTRQQKPPSETSEIGLEVRGMDDGHKVRDCSFVVHKGEVLGIAGLVGSGRTELARLIYGADRAVAGKVFLDGKEITPKSPEAALKAGLVYLTEDRKELGLFLDMSIADNINACTMRWDAGLFGTRRFRHERERAETEFKTLSIRAHSPQLPTSSLSGGNQQKVLLARLLEVKPKVILLDEPTRGVDVGSKSDIYRLIASLAQNGMTILMVSSDLPEIINVADRVLVMRDGRITGEVHPGTQGTMDQEDIMRLATGLTGLHQTAA